MSGYAHWLTVAGRPAQARACIAEALKLAADDADQRVRDQLEGTLAFAAVAEGDYDQAEVRLQAILARPERTDFAAVAAMSYLADCALGRGDGEAALEHYASALRTEMAHTDANNAVLQLIGIAASLAVLNRDVEAAVTIGTVETISREIGMSRAPVMSGGVAGATLAELEQRLTADEWDRLRARGRGITLDQAAETAYALARPQPAVGRARPRAR
jgi:tetratricopeptide (TPR) repeat protein